MATGDDATPDWINTSNDPGTADDGVSKAFTNPGLTTDLTVEFQIFCQPETGSQRFIVDFIDVATSDDILGIDIDYQGTGSGGAVTGTVYDTGSDSGGDALAIVSGFIATIKVTYDGTAVRLYTNGALAFTWTHVLDHAISLINKVFVKLRWVTGPGGTGQMKGLSIRPGIH